MRPRTSSGSRSARPPTCRPAGPGPPRRARPGRSPRRPSRRRSAAVNGLRALAGLAPVTFDPALNSEALTGGAVVGGCPSEAAGYSLLAASPSGADAVAELRRRAPAPPLPVGSRRRGVRHRIDRERARAAVRDGRARRAERAGGRELAARRVAADGAGAGGVVGGVPARHRPVRRDRDRVRGWRGACRERRPRGDRRLRRPGTGVEGRARPDDREIDVVAGGHSYRVSTFVADAPLPVAVRATHAGNVVTVTWDAAVERGVPVTGYRVQVAGLLDVTLGPEARSDELHRGCRRRLDPRHPAQPRGQPTRAGRPPSAGSPWAATRAPRVHDRRLPAAAGTSGGAGAGARCVRRTSALGGGVTATSPRAPTIVRAARIIAVRPKAGTPTRRRRPRPQRQDHPLPVAPRRPRHPRRDPPHLHGPPRRPSPLHPPPRHRRRHHHRRPHHRRRPHPT